MKAFILFALFLPQLVLAMPVSGLFGKWKAENEIWNHNVKFELSFEFTPSEAELTVDCHFNTGHQLRATTRSFATYRGNQIFIRETQEALSNDGLRYCRATLIPSRWEAYFDGVGNLTLFIPTPYQSKFDLIRVGE